MPWVAPTIGHVDSMGHLHCMECKPAPADDEIAIYADLQFTAEDKCERCGKQMVHVSTDQYVRAVP